jgi:hypothetical protein
LAFQNVDRADIFGHPESAQENWPEQGLAVAAHRHDGAVNPKRRHLDETQRSMVTANIANLHLGDSQFGSANLRTLSAGACCAANCAGIGDMHKRGFWCVWIDNRTGELRPKCFFPKTDASRFKVFPQKILP